MSLALRLIGPDQVEPSQVKAVVTEDRVHRQGPGNSRQRHFKRRSGHCNGKQTQVQQRVLAVPRRHGVREGHHSAGHDGVDADRGVATHVPDCLIGRLFRTHYIGGWRGQVLRRVA